jgi:hypothetical protein
VAAAVGRQGPPPDAPACRYVRTRHCRVPPKQTRTLVSAMYVRAGRSSSIHRSTRLWFFLITGRQQGSQVADWPRVRRHRAEIYSEPSFDIRRIFSGIL